MWCNVIEPCKSSTSRTEQHKGNWPHAPQQTGRVKSFNDNQNWPKLPPPTPTPLILVLLKDSSCWGSGPGWPCNAPRVELVVWYMSSQNKTDSGVQRPRLGSRSEELTAWKEIQSDTNGIETQISAYTRRGEDTETQVHGIGAETELDLQTDGNNTRQTESVPIKQNATRQPRGALLSPFILYSFCVFFNQLKVNWTTRSRSECKRRYRALRNSVAVKRTWRASKFVRRFLDQRGPVRVLQQGEHANTCGLLVCRAKLIWLAGLNPGAKSNSVLQSPEWGSRWGSQDDLHRFDFLFF